MKAVRLAAIVLLCPQFAGAQASGPAPAQLQVSGSHEEATYVAGRVGILLPKANDLEGFDNGLVVEAILGRRVNPYVALEASIGYLLMGFYRASDRARTSADVSAVPLTAGVKLIAPLDKVDLYGLLGAGVYFFSNEFEASGIDAVSGYYSNAATDSDASLGLTIGGGLTARLARRFTLGGDVRYLIGSVRLFRQDMRYDSLLIGGTLSWSF